MNAQTAVKGAYEAIGSLAERERSEDYRLGLTIAFEQAVSGFAGKRVLDLGSSFGLHLLAAKRMGAAECVGLDKFIFPDAFKNDFSLTREDIVSLQQVWEKEGIKIQRHDLSERLPFSDARFDLVTCHAVIEHLHGIHKELFAEINRVLAPDGIVVFTTPNLASLLKRTRFLFGRSPLWDFKDYIDSGLRFTGHVREFTVAECRSLLKWTGFDPLKVVSRPSYFNRNWIKNPAKFHNVLFQFASRLRPMWGDLVFAAGRKLCD
ncbi:MAG: class I SAM-dependent methyltransferase [Patescibacteria group bacterium]